MQSTYMRPQRHGALYAEAAREARVAEDLGFDVFLLGEHHHSYDGYCPSVLPAATFVAASTSRITLSSGVLIVPLHGPGRVAEAAAAFQAIAPSRLRLILGTGYQPDDYGAAGISLRSRGRRFEEAVDLLTGQLADRLAGTPLWSGQTAPKGLARAGRYGLPLLMSGLGLTVDDYLRRRRLYEEAWRHPGRAPRALAIFDVWVEDDARRARWVRGRLRESWRVYTTNWLDDPEPRGYEVANGPAARAALRERMLDDAAGGAIVGSPADVLDALMPFVEAGLEGIAFRIRFDGIGGRDLERCAERIAGEVVPRLRAAAR
jgi:alkanesulfonate monooxygenase SsuD/methylene tetrahydromethanopterin reductase-like flavin-dependent oxidoreductase (luciferase family)